MPSDHAGEREIVAQVCAVLAAGPTIQELRDYFGFRDAHTTTRPLAGGWWVTLILRPLLQEEGLIVLVSPSHERVRLRARMDGDRVWFVGM